MSIVAAEQIELFMSLFRGRTDIYARRWEKDGRFGYSPAYNFNWDEFMAHKRQGGSLKDFENKKLALQTKEIIIKHLSGQMIVGVYPILRDNTSYFIVADFDGESWLEDSQRFIKMCAQTGLVAYLERSRSGNGGHAWIFFSDAYPCYKSRQIVLELIRKVFKISEFEKEISFDRLFPNQNTLTAGGFGNLIALPLQGQSVLLGNTMFIDADTAKPYSDQWNYLKQIKKYSVAELDKIYQSLFSITETSFSNLQNNRKLNILVNNKIIISRNEFVPKIVHFLKEELNFFNIKYLIKKRLGKSTYKVTKYFKLIEETGENIILPRGFIQTLIIFLKKNNFNYTIHFNIPHYKEIYYQSSILLTSSQKSIMETVVNFDQGVIVAPSGSGKTIIGLELIALKKLPALILVHRKQLLDQWNERAQTFLGITKAHIGEYSAVKKKTGNQITIGLLQSFARKKDFSELKNKFGTIIVDECHHIPATTFREVISKLNPKYIYGLTASPKRKHNDEKLIYAYIGDIIARLETKDILDDENTTFAPEIFIYTSNLALPFKFTTDNFQLLVKVICFDATRNQMIISNIFERINEGHKLLVLSERKEHLEILAMYLKGRCETIVISGDDSARVRKSKLEQIVTGHYQVILSIGQFFGEGLDISNISCLILAFPFSFEGKLIQYLGRLRTTGAKKIIIDYRDQNILFLEKQFRQRLRYYKKIGAKITEVI